MDRQVKKGRVLAAMSGGVDSSVCAALLLEQGYEVVGATMLLFGEEQASEAARDAAAVCAALGIAHHVLDYRALFRREVIDRFAEEYLHGRTPNPCVLCNRALKFGALLRDADRLGCDWIATGHYANVRRDADGYYKIAHPKCAAKEQSYVLYSLGQSVLSRLLLPCGAYSKDEIRARAAALGLPVADKPDSQEICFIPQGDHAAFIDDYCGAPAPGNFVDDDGKVLGRHRGITRYTIGQRKGLGISFEQPRFVSAIHAETNEVTLSPPEKLWEKALFANDLCLAWPVAEHRLAVEAQIRYNARPAKAELTWEENGCCTVRFAEPQRAITPGQAVVFFIGDTLLGGATIRKALPPDDAEEPDDTGSADGTEQNTVEHQDAIELLEKEVLTMHKPAILKSNKLDDVRYEIRGEAVNVAAEMELAGEQIIRLNIGNLAPFGFDAPKEVIGDVVLNLRNAQGYTESKGIFSARKAIMQYYQLQNLPNLSIDNIFLGNGVSEMILMSMQGLLNAGDEMLVPSPDYPLWTAAVNLAGGKAVHYTCDEAADWAPDIADMRRKITDRTRGIIIINPNNPTGAVYPKPVLEEIVKLAREFDLMIFSDEIYDHLIMDDVPFTSIASLAPDLFCATLNGLSKSYRVTGFRSGWLVFSGDVERGRDYLAGMNLLASLRLCSNAPAQYIIQTCIGGYQSVREFVEPGGRIYEQREFIYNTLAEIPGVSVVKPKAAFYIFPRYDKNRFDFESDQGFAMSLLKEENILVVPGSGCNYPGNEHFRVVYLPEISTLKQVKKRMTRFFARHER